MDVLINEIRRLNESINRLVEFDAALYLEIIANYIKLRNIQVEAETLRQEALQWAISHGSFSGRTARQFVDDLEGRLKCGF